MLLADIDVEAGEFVAKAIETEGGTAQFLKVDVMRPADIQDMIAAAEKVFGGLDILMNNAEAGHTGPTQKFADMADEDFQARILGEIYPYFLGTKYAIPALRRRGGGAIVNTASVAGIEAHEGLTTHCVGKSAVISLTRQTAIDYAKDNIRASAICPGATMSNVAATVMFGAPGVAGSLAAGTPLARNAEPIEQAYTALFLASDESSYITGVAIAVDGGLTANSPLQIDWTKAEEFTFETLRPPS